jgi:hypothetical protein
MYPTSFFFSWTIRTLATWIKAGYFWTVTPCGKPKRAKF